MVFSFYYNSCHTYLNTCVTLGNRDGCDSKGILEVDDGKCAYTYTIADTYQFTYDLSSFIRIENPKYYQGWFVL